MLGKHVKTTFTKHIAVAFACLHSIKRGFGFEIFEAIARNQNSDAGFVKAVIGAANPLEQSR